MNEGKVVLAPLSIASGGLKNRPAIVLREMQPYGDLLLCGLSTQMHQEVEGFDEILSPDVDDFASSGLVSTSLIRLGFLGLVARRDVKGVIGTISQGRHQRLLRKLSNYLLANVPNESDNDE